MDGVEVWVVSGLENLGDNGFKEDRCSAAVFISVAVQ